MCDVGGGAVQAQPVKAVAPVAVPTATDEAALATTQAQLIQLLRLSPTLTEVAERDPSLLTNADYVRRLNPELQQFLVAHPEIVRNPEFYLFSGFRGPRGAARDALNRKVWAETDDTRADPHRYEEMVTQQVLTFLSFICIVGTLLWLIQVFLANRRWDRTFRIQMEAHERMLARFTSNDQLMQYLETAGKRFWDSVPQLEEGRRSDQIPNVVAPVLASVQVGVVMALLGSGLLMAYHHTARPLAVLLVFGFVLLAAGIGLLISAGVTWALAQRLGLIPRAAASAEIQP